MRRAVAEVLTGSVSEEEEELLAALAAELEWDPARACCVLKPKSRAACVCRPLARSRTLGAISLIILVPLRTSSCAVFAPLASTCSRWFMSIALSTSVTPLERLSPRSQH